MSKREVKQVVQQLPSEKEIKIQEVENISNYITNVILQYTNTKSKNRKKYVVRNYHLNGEQQRFIYTRLNRGGIYCSFEFNYDDTIIIAGPHSDEFKRKLKRKNNARNRLNKHV